jgi:membrane protein
MEERCLTRAMALSYSTLFAVVPLFAAALLLFKALGTGSEQDFILQYTERLLNMLMPDVAAAGGENFAAVLASHIEVFAERLSAEVVGTVGAVFLVGSTMSTLITAEESLNDIWGVKRGRSFIKSIVIYVIMIAVLLVLMIPALSTQFIAQSQAIVDRIESVVPLTPLANLIEGSVIPILVMTAGLMLFYIVLPSGRVRIRSAFMGAFIAAILINLVVHVFGALLTLTGKIESLTVVYGILAIVPLFLMFTYIVWAIVLLGAEFAFVDQEKIKGNVPPPLIP